MNQTKLYNLDRLSQYVGNDDNQVKEMINIFLNTVPQDIDQLQKSADKEKWDKVYEVAHRIKPSVDVFEMNEVLVDIKRIEKLARDNNIENNLAELIKKLSEKFNSIILLLEKELEK